MNKKSIAFVILSSIIFGALGSWFFSRYLIPKLDTAPFFIKHNILPPAAPLVINTTQQIHVDNSEDMVTAVQSVEPWTVGIFTTEAGSSAVQTLGSGLILTSDGLIATTQQALASAPAQSQLWVKTINGTVFKATLMSEDPASGLALIQAGSLKNQPTASFDNPDNMQLGDEVAVIWQSAGQYQAESEVTHVTSETRNTPTNKVLFSDTISRTFMIGNSQTPEEGAVIAYNDGGVEGIYSQSGIIVAGTIQSALSSYFNNNDSILRPGFGVYYQYQSPDIASMLGSQEGIIVKQPNAKTAAILAGSPAQESGIQPGDLIYSVNGTSINFDNSFENLMYAHSPNDVLTLDIMRAGKPVVINIILKSNKSK